MPTVKVIIVFTKINNLKFLFNFELFGKVLIVSSGCMYEL